MNGANLPLEDLRQGTMLVVLQLVTLEFISFFMPAIPEQIGLIFAVYRAIFVSPANGCKGKVIQKKREFIGKDVL